jgi:hypothetical protein
MENYNSSVTHNQPEQFNRADDILDFKEQSVYGTPFKVTL